jgi:uncharacterized protein (DUF58 family)
MIVPEERFLWMAALSLVPAAVLAALLPALAGVLPLVALVLIGLAILDILLVSRLAQTITADATENIRFSCGRSTNLSLRLGQHSGQKSRVRVGLALPDGMETGQREWVGELGQESATLRWPLTATRRGHYALGPVFVRLTSPLRLWARQLSFPIESEAAVYPNLSKERKALAAFFLNRGTSGMHQLRQVGQGREFEKVREYLAGDSLGDIHWKATAKRRHLVTKEFQIERTQRIFLCVDSSRLSARQEIEGQDPLLEQFIGAALALGLAAERQGDLYGLATFSGQLESLVRFGSGKAHFGVLRDTLYRLKTADVSPDFGELAASLSLHLRRRAMIMVLTNLDDPAIAEDFLQHFTPLASKHLVVVTMSRPQPARPLYTGADVTQQSDLYQRLGGHMIWNSLQELERKLRQKNVGFALIERDQLATELVARYLDIKRRQIL